MRFFPSDSVNEAVSRVITALKNRSPRVSFCMSLCNSLICTLLLPSFLSDGSIGFSNSFLSLVYAAVLFALFRWYLEKKHGRRELVLTHIFGFMLSCMTAIGSAVGNTGKFLPAGAALCLSILIYTHVFACAVSLLWSKLGRFHVIERNASASRLNGWISYAVSRPWIVMLILIACWLPCYIALFPGGFSYDMAVEFEQQYSIYSSDFPRLHTVLIIGFINAAHSLFGSYNAGIAIYAGIQMTLFSALFTYMLVSFYRRGVRRAFILFFAAYFALFPVIHLIVTHTGRDTLFAGLLTFLVFLMYQIACDAKEFFASAFKPVLLGAVLSLTLLSRNNSGEFLMLLLLVGLNLFVLLKSRRLKMNLKGIKLFCISNVAVFALLSLVLAAICRPMSPANPRASMSLVGQTFVRAYIDEPEKWSAQEKAAFAHYVRMEDFRYCPECADYSKNLLQNIKGGKNTVAFVKMWLKMGIKCPRSYFNAIAAQTRYIWYPDSLIDGYVRAEIYKTEKCYFVTGVEKPGTRVPLWPEGEEFYRKIGKDVSFEKIPVLSMIFSIGFQYWLLLNCLFYAVYRRRKKLLIPLAVIFVYLAFCFFIPLVIMRYFMPLFLLFPLTVIMTVDHGSDLPKIQKDVK